MGQEQQDHQGRNDEVEDPEGEDDDEDRGEGERVEHDVGRARQAFGEPFGEPGGASPDGAGGGHQAVRGAFPAGAGAFALPEPLDDFRVGEAAAEAGVEDHPLPRLGVQVAGRGIARQSLGELLPAVLGHGRARHFAVSERDYLGRTTEIVTPNAIPKPRPARARRESSRTPTRRGREW